MANGTRENGDVTPISLGSGHETADGGIGIRLKFRRIKMLSSPSVEKAPTFGSVLTRSTPRAELPEITHTSAPANQQRNGLRGTACRQRSSSLTESVTDTILKTWLGIKALRTPPPKSKTHWPTEALTTGCKLVKGFLAPSGTSWPKHRIIVAGIPAGGGHRIPRETSIAQVFIHRER